MLQMQKKHAAEALKSQNTSFSKAHKSWIKAEFLTYDVIFSIKVADFLGRKSSKIPPYQAYLTGNCFFFRKKKTEQSQKSKEGGSAMRSARTARSYPFNFLCFCWVYRIFRLYVHSMPYSFPLKITVSVHLPIFTDLSLGAPYEALIWNCHVYLTHMWPLPKTRNVWFCLRLFSGGGGTINNDNIYGFGPRATTG